MALWPTSVSGSLRMSQPGAHHVTSSGASCGKALALAGHVLMPGCTGKHSIKEGGFSSWGGEVGTSRLKPTDGACRTRWAGWSSSLPQQDQVAEAAGLEAALPPPLGPWAALALAAAGAAPASSSSSSRAAAAAGDERAGQRLGSQQAAPLALRSLHRRHHHCCRRGQAATARRARLSPPAQPEGGWAG